MSNISPSNFSRQVKTHFPSHLDLKHLVTRHPHFKNVAPCGLVRVMKYFGLEATTNHQAGTDADLAMQLFFYCRRNLPEYLDYGNKLWSL